jgi:hypothetical protein
VVQTDNDTHIPPKTRTLKQEVMASTCKDNNRQEVANGAIIALLFNGAYRMGMLTMYKYNGGKAFTVYSHNTV